MIIVIASAFTRDGYFSVLEYPCVSVSCVSWVSSCVSGDTSNVDILHCASCHCVNIVAPPLFFEKMDLGFCSRFFVRCVATPSTIILPVSVQTGWVIFRSWRIFVSRVRCTSSHQGLSSLSSQFGFDVVGATESLKSGEALSFEFGHVVHNVCDRAHTVIGNAASTASFTVPCLLSARSVLPLPTSVATVCSCSATQPPVCTCKPLKK